MWAGRGRGFVKEVNLGWTSKEWQDLGSCQDDEVPRKWQAGGRRQRAGRQEWVERSGEQVAIDLLLRRVEPHLNLIHDTGVRLSHLFLSDRDPLCPGVGENLNCGHVHPAAFNPPRLGHCSSWPVRRCLPPVLAQSRWWLPSFQAWHQLPLHHPFGQAWHGLLCLSGPR